MIKFLLMVLAMAITAATALPADLLNGSNLDGSQVVGGGSWTVMKDGTLVGQSDPQNPFEHQSWLYTVKEFDEYDLHLEYRQRLAGRLRYYRHVFGL